MTGGMGPQGELGDGASSAQLAGERVHRARAATRAWGRTLRAPGCDNPRLSSALPWGLPSALPGGPISSSLQPVQSCALGGQPSLGSCAGSCWSAPSRLGRVGRWVCFSLSGGQAAFRELGIMDTCFTGFQAQERRAGGRVFLPEPLGWNLL